MKDKKQRNGNLLTIFIISCVIFVAVFLSIYLKNKIDKAVYDERKESLSQLIENSTNSIDDNIATQWEIARVYENDLVAHVQEYNSIEEYLGYLNTQIVNKNDYYFLVDSSGKYYCSDGNNGKIIDTDYYLSSTDKDIEYLSSLPHLEEDVSYLILRSRLEEPIQFESEKGTIEIAYACLMHDMQTLNNRINSLFGGKNNVIIFNRETGVMLYKQFGIGLLVNGYNAYQKYENVELLYDGNGVQAIEDCKQKKTSIVLMNLQGIKYYICSSPLNVSNWSLMLVVEGEYFNQLSEFSFGNITLSIVLILACLVIAVMAAFLYINKLRVNRRILENEVKVNEALKDAYETKSNFLSYMSHDIRTPINGIIGMSSIGTLNKNDPEKVEECFKKIDLSSKHLLAIVNDVLDMSAIESGKVIIQKEKMNIYDTVSNCLDIIKGSLNDRDLKIEEEYDCKDKEVLGDELHLKQIIVNILSNAVKFTPDKGTIRLSCIQINETKEEVTYQIKISDTGIGMSKDFQQHIFEAFKQANPNGRSNYKGTGLGMAISNEYIKLMNGTIQVDSNLNEGSTFTLVIPFKRLSKQENETKLDDLNILLVEDNELNMEIAKTLLEDKVKSIQIARDGKQAVELFEESKENSFDLILMDVMMPVMNGLESTKAIRNLKRKDKDIPIIALTANTYKDDIDAIHTSGMNGYLNKPFTVEQLIKKIKGGGKNK